LQKCKKYDILKPWGVLLRGFLFNRIIIFKEVSNVGIPFRSTAGFGKRMEYNLFGKMLMEGLDVYLPLVDDHGVDCVIKKPNGTFIEVQIKARSKDVAPGDAALFAAISHEPSENFYFVFYSERLETMWILSSE
jgi:hypothetical protein